MKYKYLLNLGSFLISTFPEFRNIGIRLLWFNDHHQYVCRPVSLNVKLACYSISHPHGVTKLLGEHEAVEVGSIPWAFPTEMLFF